MNQLVCTPGEKCIIIETFWPIFPPPQRWVSAKNLKFGYVLSPSARLADLKGFFVLVFRLAYRPQNRYAKQHMCRGGTVLGFLCWLGCYFILVCHSLCRTGTPT